ncbi:hypothetical protein FRUB_03071 [Fimbriiglobus ruber]|uniref:DUF2325 domain-containing protein n=1 Tax=Fimbriiglobus ruber TaxID=1908690 RepID=A0A225DQ31_9BACT|nr:hypothetical protein FRUB_03071 [Fimbriiglobus ruber]
MIDEHPELGVLPLPVLVQRCRVKAAAARLVVQQLAPGAGNTTAEEEDLRRWADRLPDCYLWMLAPDRPSTAPKLWSDLEGGYTTVADAAELLLAWEESGTALGPKVGEEVLSLAAEAQSTLLYAVADVRMVKQDYEQVQLYIHIREAARKHRLFVHRYLKREDRTDPGNWPQVVRRITETAAKFRAAEDKFKSRQKILGNIRYKLQKLAARPADYASEWPRIMQLIDGVIADGLPPSNVELREFLVPVLDSIPDDLETTENVQRVFREIDSYLAAREAEGEQPKPAPPTAEVAEVARLLRGQELVLIGGQARPQHRAALMRALGVGDVRWLSTPDHTSFTVFEPDIARPEVAVVVLAIRWSNHSYSEVQQFCAKYDKPLVRLPRGYNANQVAHEILSQAGDRLRAEVAVGAVGD